jgi:hypothetical protein
VAAKIVSAGVVAAALLIAGCGSSHKSSDTAAHASTPTGPTATAETRPEVPADHAIAAAALLRLPDFPTGWQQQDQSGGKSSLTCPAIATARASVSGRATSPQFAKGSDDFVDDAAYVYPSVSAAQASFARLSGPSARLCIGKAFGTQLAKAAASTTGKVTFGQPTTAVLSIPSVGEQSAAGRITIPYAASGLNLDAVIDLGFVRVDRGIQVLLFIGSSGAPDAALESNLTGTAADRLAAELHVSTPGAATTTTTTRTTATATTPKTTPTPTTTTPARTTTTPTTPTQTTTTPTQTTTTPATGTTTTPSGSQPSASAVAKAKQLLPICRREQPNITLQELEREAASPLGIQC